MHEEPIVCTPVDAIRGFIDGKLDYLVINNFLIKNKVKSLAFKIAFDKEIIDRSFI